MSEILDAIILKELLLAINVKGLPNILYIGVRSSHLMLPNPKFCWRFVVNLFSFRLDLTDFELFTGFTWKPKPGILPV
jgi:hypothetical protein